MTRISIYWLGWWWSLSFCCPDSRDWGRLLTCLLSTWPSATFAPVSFIRWPSIPLWSIADGPLANLVCHRSIPESALMAIIWFVGFNCSCWLLGCNLYGTGVGFFGLNTIVTLAAIAYERYVVITAKPAAAKWRITRRQAQKVCHTFQALFLIDRPIDCASCRRHESLCICKKKEGQCVSWLHQFSAATPYK